MTQRHSEGNATQHGNMTQHGNVTKARVTRCRRESARPKVGMSELRTMNSNCLTLRARARVSKVEGGCNGEEI
jgi:hypothetical protein